MPVYPFPLMGASGNGSAGTIRVLLAVLPAAAAAAAYLVYVERSLSRRTVATTRVSPPDPLPRNWSPWSMDDDDSDTASSSTFGSRGFRVTSLPIPVSRLRPEFLLPRAEGEPLDDDDALLRAYLATTMRCFARTPQARLMRRMAADDAGARASFAPAYLARCGFEAGDRVCGVYVVRSRRTTTGAGGGRSLALLDLSPPAGWAGPAVEGCLACGFVREGPEAVRFVNETVMCVEGRGGRAGAVGGVGGPVAARARGAVDGC
ncbi:hypothetical protein F5X99DRAFT_426579 [Biscogniauxia marginata]|nr:hypothetical protein F5X99DRAFT_426579 [Biscogniauxia marginata]